MLTLENNMNTINDIITLITPTGEEKNEIIISYDDEENVDEIKLNYNDKDYCTHKIDFLWVEGYADLQKQLPSDVKLKCCLTCKHGNLCPVGNSPNQIFCTKDVLITSKMDAFYYTAEDSNSQNRIRTTNFVCDSFEEQNDDYYTYNDYLYHLEK